MINLGTEEDKKEVKISANLENSIKDRLIQMFHDYVEVFSWSYEDMSGLDTDIVVHRIPMKEDYLSVKQKVCRMRPNMSKKIKAEVMKQFDACFLEVTSYPQWVANVVPVPKKDGKVRICLDYRDLNRESPKDNFPLPHIDVLVDNTAQHKVFSFMENSPITIKSKWHPKTWRKPLFSHSGAPSVIRSCLSV